MGRKNSKKQKNREKTRSINKTEKSDNTDLGYIEICTKDGRSNHVRSHVTIFDSTPTTPIQQLPRDAANAPHIMVRYIGPFTTDEIARKKKSFDVTP